MIHAAAIHFLEVATKRLDATLVGMELDGKTETDEFKQMTQARTDVQDSIETLQALQFVDRKAAEIRSRNN